MEPNAEKKYIHFELFTTPRSRTIVALNNIVVVNTLTSAALKRIREQLSSTTGRRSEFKVPVLNGDKITVTRDKVQILNLIDKTRKRELVKESLISAVALVENYLAQTLEMVLRWYPEKLSASPSGSSEERKVDLRLILESTDLDDLLSRVIRTKISSIFFESPTEYFNHIEKILTFKLPQDVKLTYVEIKATRDILVHNAGMVNDTYLRKVRENARGKLGELIPLDKTYLDNSVTRMKHLIKHVYEGCLQKYGNVNK